MTFTVTPHLNFRGRARAALTFYRNVFGGELTLMTYEAMGQADVASRPDDVIFGQVATQDGFCIMAFDVQAGRAYEPGANAFFVTLKGSSPDEVRGRWTALADGATILQPIGPSSWSPLYGMLTDRFGITWIVAVAPQIA